MDNKLKSQQAQLETLQMIWRRHLFCFVYLSHGLKSYLYSLSDLSVCLHEIKNITVLEKHWLNSKVKMRWCFMLLHTSSTKGLFNFHLKLLFNFQLFLWHFSSVCSVFLKSYPGICLTDIFAHLKLCTLPFKHKSLLIFGRGYLDHSYFLHLDLHHKLFSVYIYTKKLVWRIFGLFSSPIVEREIFLSGSTLVFSIRKCLAFLWLTVCSRVHCWYVQSFFYFWKED